MSIEMCEGSLQRGMRGGGVKGSLWHQRSCERGRVAVWESRWWPCCVASSRYPKMMDKALQAAVVSMATEQHCSDSEEEEEEWEGRERGSGESHMRWLHDFVTLALSGSRHQVPHAQA